MDLFRSAILPGVIAGLVSIFTSWLWMGVIFHRYQARTPESWRRETNLSYALSSAIHLFACVVVAILFHLAMANGNLFFGSGILGAFRFGALVWMAMAAPLAIDAGVFVRLHPWVIVGQLLDWLTTSLVACLLTAVWSSR